MKKSIIRRALAILIIFAVAFTYIPVLSGTAIASAASSYWKNVRITGAAQTTVSLSWTKLTKKQQKKINGITVFRNGVAVKNLNKTATSCAITGLKAGTEYNFQIKTYKKTTKKIKMWYNKNTKKWQTKKPAKKYRGKSKKVKKTTYKYSNASPKKAVTTKKAPVSTKPSVTMPASSSGTSTGSTSGSSGSTGNTSTGTSGTSTGSSAETKMVTDYLGVTRTITKESGEKYYYSEDGEQINPIQRFDRTVAGEFTISGGSVMVQTGGSDSATFYKNELNGQGTESIDLETTTSAMRYDMDQRFGFRMFGGDPSKLTYEADHEIETVNTWAQASGIKQYKEVTNKYIKASDGTYLQRVLQIEIGKLKYPSKTANYGFTCLLMKPDRSVGCGFSNETVTITIKYNGKKIGEISWSPFGSASSVNGMTPNRALAWKIAQAAIEANGGKKDYYTDMRWIQQWFYDEYTYGQALTGDGGASFSAGCEGGAFVLETYSIKEYGVYGFNGYGNKDPEQDTHTSFNLNSEPEVFFETQGH